MTEKARLKGSLRVDVFDCRRHCGTKIRTMRSTRWHKNIVTTAGLSAVRDILAGYAKPPTAIAYGVGTTVAELTDTGLADEIGRVDLIRRTRPNAFSVRFQAFLPESHESNGSSITEAGLVNSTAADSGVLFARVLFDSIEKTPSVSVTFTWQWTIA